MPGPYNVLREWIFVQEETGGTQRDDASIALTTNTPTPNTPALNLHNQAHFAYSLRLTYRIGTLNYYT